MLKLTPNFKEILGLLKCKKCISYLAPLGAPGRPATQNSSLPSLMEDPTVQSIAKDHGKTAAQILIRFAIQRGIFVIPKSTKPERIVQNGNVFDFNLYAADMQALHAMNKDQRFFVLSFHDHHYYPFQPDYTE